LAEREASAETGIVQKGSGSIGLLQQTGAGFPSAVLTFFPQIEQLYVNSFMKGSLGCFIACSIK
jgi:hypothetical protein